MLVRKMLPPSRASFFITGLKPGFISVYFYYGGEARCQYLGNLGRLVAAGQWLAGHGQSRIIMTPATAVPKLLLFLTAAFQGEAFGGIRKSGREWSEEATGLADEAERAVTIVRHVMKGPARGRTLTFSLDTTLPATVKDAISSLPQFQPPVSDSLHVALFSNLSHQTTSLGSVTHPPRHLLLVSLRSGHDITALLTQPWLSGVQSLALVTPVSGSLVTYTLLPFCSPSLHYLGHWSTHTFHTWESLFPDRFLNTCHTVFHVAMKLEDPPYFYRRRLHSQPVGVSVNMLRALSTKLNFSYDVTEDSLDGTWGVLEGGKWSGMLGMVNRGEYNFTGNGFIQSLERMEAFDFGEYIYQDKVSVFLRKPVPVQAWMDLVRPFSVGVWAALLVTLLLSSAFFTLQARLQKRSNRSVSSLYLMRVLLSQSTPPSDQPRSRLLVSVWLLVCLILTSAFTSNLVGIFTTNTFPAPITSLSQLAAQSTIRLTVPDHGSFVSNQLKRAEDYVSLRRFLGRIELFPLECEAVGGMTAGTHGFVEVATHTMIMLTTKYKKRNWYRVKEAFLTVEMSWVYKKGTAWKTKLDEKIKWLKYTGVIEQWYKMELQHLDVGRKWRGRGKGVNDDPDTTGGRGRPLTTSHLQGLFFLLGLAWVFSIVVFLLEKTHQKMCCSFCPIGSVPLPFTPDS
ncbi:hypothetical protein Pmani_011436 [Petrolisthes manimaculis]|uniref:Ionotropic glutamate receptor L-glutamate and glycine-binding domain-containing protein n=1 Tax=Petrolisthes manimaculis TaxID=1843537 RepID=A0AAE1PZ91_9EUCA|nr:hypothetical protein Pmani_011436 [Petrolisthes manimaculis]